MTRWNNAMMIRTTVYGPENKQFVELVTSPNGANKTVLGGLVRIYKSIIHSESSLNFLPV